MDYALQPRDGDIVAALVNGFESTMKIYSRKGDEITLTPIETKRHFPLHVSREPDRDPGGPGRNRPQSSKAQAVKTAV